VSSFEVTAEDRKRAVAVLLDLAESYTENSEVRLQAASTVLNAAAFEFSQGEIAALADEIAEKVKK
jgi:hypothetical protein